MTHTPGPWKVQGPDRSGDFTVVIPCPCEKHENCYAERFQDNLLEPDARLIAAAPDLLTALEDYIAAYGGDWHPSTIQTEVRNYARAVVAKAKGEAE